MSPKRVANRVNAQEMPWWCHCWHLVQKCITTHSPGHIWLVTPWPFHALWKEQLTESLLLNGGTRPWKYGAPYSDMEQALHRICIPVVCPGALKTPHKAMPCQLDIEQWTDFQRLTLKGVPSFPKGSQFKNTYKLSVWLKQKEIMLTRKNFHYLGKFRLGFHWCHQTLRRK